MAAYDYNTLKKKYNDFLDPVAEITANKKEFSKNKGGYVVSDVTVELTCGYEASIASFSIYNSFDREDGKFLWEGLKDYFSLGSQITVKAGYGSNISDIFTGFVSKVNFIYGGDEIPHVEILCMDIKGVMMAGSHENQMTATNFGDSISEIFRKSVYEKMKSNGIFTQISVTPTPDKNNSESNKESDKTIEVTGESDYEFTVRAAKRFNYEFFTDCGKVLFRKARTPEVTLMSLNTTRGVSRLSVEYDIVGQVENVQIRGMDYGNAELIAAKRKLNNTMSYSSKAKQIISGSEKIYVDSSVKSPGDADYRLENAVERITYGFGLMNCKCTGIPELKPGNFIEIEGMGQPPSNKFYLVEVKHSIDDEEGFVTELTGKTDRIK